MPTDPQEKVVPVVEPTKPSTPVVGNVVPNAGDHDRVVMLSLQADGTPDQHNPEIIGDKDFALAAARRQFAEQAVSAADVIARGSIATEPESTTPDPTVTALAKEHEVAEKAAVAAADSTVSALFKE